MLTAKSWIVWNTKFEEGILIYRRSIRGQDGTLLEHRHSDRDPRNPPERLENRRLQTTQTFRAEQKRVGRDVVVAGQSPRLTCRQIFFFARWPPAARRAAIHRSMISGKSPCIKFPDQANKFPDTFLLRPDNSLFRFTPAAATSPAKCVT